MLVVTFTFSQMYCKNFVVIEHVTSLRPALVSQHQSSKSVVTDLHVAHQFYLAPALVAFYDATLAETEVALCIGWKSVTFMSFTFSHLDEPAASMGSMAF